MNTHEKIFIRIVDVMYVGWILVMWIGIFWFSIKLLG